MKKFDYTLYLVTDRRYAGDRSLEKIVEESIIGGVTFVQMREKSMKSEDMIHLAKGIKAVTDTYQIPFVINDRLDIALEIQADGVHLGQDDLPIDIARKYLGHNKIIGISVGSVEEALEAERKGADYLGVGSLFPTPSKDDAVMVSKKVLEEIISKTSIPVVGIGGITEANVKDLKETGLDGIAVISAILGKEDIRSASEKLKKAFLQK